LNNILIIWLNKDKYYNYNDYNVFSKLNIELEKDKYNIVHMNSWFDLFVFKRKKWVKYIFESHAIHPGISLKYSLLITESFTNKIVIVLFYPIFKLIFLLKIKQIDLYLVSIPWLLDLTKNYNSLWLPNPIDITLFYKNENHLELDNNYINIFYPTWLREIKNPVFAFELIKKIKLKYNNTRFYFIKQSVSNYKRYEKYIKNIEENIIWLDQIDRDKITYYYSADWDLVLGSFYPEKPYAVLNMIELEAMACKAPIIVSDLNELIFKNFVELKELAFNIIENKDFREKYIEKNYEYILSKHSWENVAKIYEKYINKLLN